MAFALTLAKHTQSLASGPMKRDRSDMKERILRKAILRAEEDYADDAKVEEAEEEAIEVATELSTPLSDTHRKMLDRMSAWAETAKNRRDSKAEAILAWIDEHLKTNGEPNDMRVILFTEYRATHSWLMQILATSGWGGNRLMTLHGGTDPDERDIIRRTLPGRTMMFRRCVSLGDGRRFGRDRSAEPLQLHDPHRDSWNPNVMEQRNGRIDRHGQKQKQVFVWHPVGAGEVGGASEMKAGDLTGDHEFLCGAVKKVDSIRQDLGCVGPVIARQIEEAMLGKRQRWILGKRKKKLQRFVSS